MAGDPIEARRTHRVNLRVCRAAGWQADIASCHVGLGNLEMDAGRFDEALQEYEQAIGISKSITRRDTLIDALLARGRLAARLERWESAAPDLEEALTFATLGGFQIAEIDARIALATMHLAAAAVDAAWRHVARAEQMSVEISYHWGAVAAQDVLRQIRP
jgi:tetratricopeptide (TPR) repeat protein